MPFLHKGIPGFLERMGDRGDTDLVIVGCLVAIRERYGRRLGCKICRDKRSVPLVLYILLGVRKRE